MQSSNKTKASETKHKEQTLCCKSPQPYKPTKTDYEALFKFFLYAQYGIGSHCTAPVGDAIFCIQVVSQINFMAETRQAEYFLVEQGKIEKCDEDMFKKDFVRLNSFKNFVCKEHNRFFEINGYKKGQVSSSYSASLTEGNIYQRDTSLDGVDPRRKGSQIT